MSTTYVAVIVSSLVFILPMIGIQVISEETLLKSITELIGALAILYTFYGRFRAGGITKFGLRVK